MTLMAHLMTLMAHLMTLMAHLKFAKFVVKWAQPQSIGWLPLHTPTSGSAQRIPQRTAQRIA